MGPGKAFRAKLFRALHSEAVKRKMDHDALHDFCAQEMGVKSMSDLTEHQMAALYRQWTGKTIKRRATLPKVGEAADGGPEQLISGDEIMALDAEFAKRDLRDKGRAAFVRRQLRGRDEIRTRRDYAKVMGGLRAMNRKAGL
jgi:hypothetical protein